MARGRPPRNPEPAGDEMLVTSRALIRRYLDEAVGTDGALTLNFPNAPDAPPLVSRIRRIEDNGHDIVLHQLQPASHRPPAHKQVLVEVSCQLAIGKIRFTGVLSPLDDSTLSPYWLLTLPEQLRLRQVRSHFRVPLDAIDARLSLPLPAGGRVEADLLDLSVGGALCQLKGRPVPIRPGLRLAGCHLRIEGLLDFQLDVQVSHHEDTDEGGLQLGLRFCDLAPRQQKQLQQALCKIERLNIRLNKLIRLN